MVVVRVIIGVILCVLLPLCLHYAGMSKHQWAVSSNTTCQPYVKLTGNICYENYEDVYTIVFISSVILALPLVLMILICCRTSDENVCYNLALAACYIGFPFVGILILIGCIVFSTDFDTSDLEISFYLCLSAGCCHIIGMLYLIANIFWEPKDRNVDENAIEVPNFMNVPSISKYVDFSFAETSQTDNGSETSVV